MKIDVHIVVTIDTTQYADKLETRAQIEEYIQNCISGFADWPPIDIGRIRETESWEPIY